MVNITKHSEMLSSVTSYNSSKSSILVNSMLLREICKAMHLSESPACALQHLTHLISGLHAIFKFFVVSLL